MNEATTRVFVSHMRDDSNCSLTTNEAAYIRGTWSHSRSLLCTGELIYKNPVISRFSLCIDDSGIKTFTTNNEVLITVTHSILTCHKGSSSISIELYDAGFVVDIVGFNLSIGEFMGLIGSCTYEFGREKGCTVPTARLREMLACLRV